MTLKQKLTNYLSEGKTMQVATSRSNNPWVVSVFYVVDGEYNFYWLSLPSRRHSQEILDNNQAAATIVIKQDLPVIGVYTEGKVTVVRDQMEVKKIARAYEEKYDTAKSFYDRFVEGINQHWVYRLKPATITLFDEYNNPNAPVQTINRI